MKRHRTSNTQKTVERIRGGSSAVTIRLERTGFVWHRGRERCGKGEMGGHSRTVEQNCGRVHEGAHGQSVPLLAGELRGGLPSWRDVSDMFTRTTCGVLFSPSNPTETSTPQPRD